jgi:hypothetical protein
MSQEAPHNDAIIYCELVLGLLGLLALAWLVGEAAWMAMRAVGWR